MTLENTSDDVEENIVPDEIKGWNWAAFLMGYIWVIRNNLPFKYFNIAWIPFYGMYYLGRKGNELAWRYNYWFGVEDFKNHQKKELNIAICFLIIWFVSLIAISSILILLQR